MHTNPADLTPVTVADVLELPELAAGQPELAAGAAGLQRRLRWAHVVAGAAAIGLLDGGELILTTGAGWPTAQGALERLATELAGVDPAAVVLELGAHFETAPEPLVRVCGERAIPLIVLHREVRFVQITQRIHQRVLAAQNEALSARTEIHEMLTELGLNRSPVDYVIDRLSETLDAPVVLEDPSGRVVAWAARDRDPESVLAAWTQPGEPALPADAERVVVEAQGRRWGTLSALGGPAHPAGRRTVLELGALALALGRLADTSGEAWLRLSSKQLFDTLLSGRYRRDAELAVQLAAAGLPVTDRVLVGATLRGTGDFGAHGPLERALLETALRRAVAPEGRVILVPDTEAADGGARATLLALLSFPRGDPRVAPSAGDSPTPLVTRLARELDMLLPSTTPASWRAHLGLGADGTGVRSLITSLERVRAAGQLRPSAAAGRVTAQVAERQALAYLVRGFAGSPELQEYATATLGPLVAHDAASGPGHSGDLLRVLRAYLDQPTNRSLAAERARLSRSVFYQRLALIEELLDVDLADGTTIATLAVALLALG
ncbi:PucR family transcriptional regulator [Leucobacter luti]|uniref:Purine catabolism regulator n=1 Tax=Leucobacter luti TaxID=340320 RepID=A0A4Q7TQ39_9MICO|nr:PucR family transcriptional regulator [Leucobacter luti]MBL3699800.1 PucR family transcriptional regulator [Leucobacter luti]RZT62881.1 purine catabolism regulator [Leucobacter luti]